ncbi:MAG: Spy/CpxP family protein refolding chaperone [Candidatus Methylomirabilales bacterium]
MSPRTRYLATTLVLLAIGLGFGLSQWQGRPAPPRPPARRGEVPARPSLPPTAPDVLARAAELDLDGDQVARLRALASAWTADVAGLEAALRQAEAEFAEFAAAAKSGGGASLPEIRRRSGELQELSAELRERRSAHSSRALGVLTDVQRAKLRAEASHPSGGRA